MFTSEFLVKLHKQNYKKSHFQEWRAAIQVMQKEAVSRYGKYM